MTKASVHRIQKLRYGCPFSQEDITEIIVNDLLTTSNNLSLKLAGVSPFYQMRSTAWTNRLLPIARLLKTS